jgi:hypothetical protein
VIDDVHAGDRAVQGGGVAKVALDQLDAVALEIRCTRDIADERSHSAATLDQRPSEVASGEPGCAGDEI